MSERMFAATQFQPKEFVFNSENKVEAEKIVAKYPIGRQASALLPLLDLAQRQHGGWLPKTAIRYVAGLLDVPEIRAFEVASFYTMFNLSPRGKFLVQLCRTTPCWLRGSDELQGVCARHLGIKVVEVDGRAFGWTPLARQGDAQPLLLDFPVVQGRQGGDMHQRAPIAGAVDQGVGFRI